MPVTVVAAGQGGRTIGAGRLLRKAKGNSGIARGRGERSEPGAASRSCIPQLQAVRKLLCGFPLAASEALSFVWVRSGAQVASGEATLQDRGEERAFRTHSRVSSAVGRPFCVRFGIDGAASFAQGSRNVPGFKGRRACSTSLKVVHASDVGPASRRGREVRGIQAQQQRSPSRQRR